MKRGRRNRAAAAGGGKTQNWGLVATGKMRQWLPLAFVNIIAAKMLRLPGALVQVRCDGPKGTRDAQEGNRF